LCAGRTLETGATLVEEIFDPALVTRAARPCWRPDRGRRRRSFSKALFPGLRGLARRAARLVERHAVKRATDRPAARS
jgi:hypothetical protein